MTTPDLIQHDEALELLPWLVNGSLDSSEHDAVKAHAKNCVICRRELAELRVVQQSVATLGESSEIPAPDMRRINARIDAALEQRTLAGLLAEYWHLMTASRLRVAFAVQSLVLVAVTVMIFLPQEPADRFTTLSTLETLPAGHYLCIVFDPTIPEEEAARMIEANQLSVVAGPSDRGVITLRFPDTLLANERRTILRGMQSESRILFVQPVEGAQ